MSRTIYFKVQHPSDARSFETYEIGDGEEITVEKRFDLRQYQYREVICDLEASMFKHTRCDMLTCRSCGLLKSNSLEGFSDAGFKLSNRYRKCIRCGPPITSFQVGQITAFVCGYCNQLRELHRPLPQAGVKRLFPAATVARALEHPLFTRPIIERIKRDKTMCSSCYTTFATALEAQIAEVADSRVQGWIHASFNEAGQLSWTGDQESQRRRKYFNFNRDRVTMWDVGLFDDT